MNKIHCGSVYNATPIPRPKNPRWLWILPTTRNHKGTCYAEYVRKHRRLRNIFTSPLFRRKVSLPALKEGADNTRTRTLTMTHNNRAATDRRPRKYWITYSIGSGKKGTEGRISTGERERDKVDPNTHCQQPVGRSSRIDTSNRAQLLLRVSQSMFVRIFHLLKTYKVQQAAIRYPYGGRYNIRNHIWFWLLLYFVFVLVLPVEVGSISSSSVQPRG